MNKTVEDLNRELTAVVLPITIVMAVTATLGIVGNCLVLHVYTARYPKCNFKYFVVFLALIDLTNCVATMPMEIFTLLHWYVFYWPALCKVKSFLIVFTVSSSASALLLIAIDRFRKVWRPHSKQIKPELAVKLSVVVVCVALIPSTSDAILWGVQTFNMTTTNLGADVVVSMCEKDDAYKDTIWPTLHTVMLYTASNLIVMAATLVLYILIAMKMFCPTVSQLHAPAIRVTTPELLEEDSQGGNRTSVFKFPSDIESGLSESEDLDKESGARQSAGSLSDIELRSKESESRTSAELRHSNGSIGENKRAVRLSTEFLQDNDLKLPASPTRRKTSNTRSKPATRHQRRRSTIGSIGGSTNVRLRRKTLIMFILTAVFISTTVLYLAMISYMASTSHFVTTLTTGEGAAWFFFLRLYFINSVMNPILYGFLDPRFKRSLWNMGVHVSWLAGSLRRTLGQSVRHSGDDVTVVMRQRQPPRKRPYSSTGGSSH